MKLKKTDILIITLLLILSACMYYFFSLQKDTGVIVAVKCDGKTIAEYPLDKDITLTIGSEKDFNVLEIKDGKVKITEADCPDKLCVKQKEISLNGETIICLPHKLVVEIEGGENTEVDSVS